MNKSDKVNSKKLQLTAKELKHIQTRYKDTALVVWELQQKEAETKQKPSNYLEYSTATRYSAFGNDKILIPNQDKKTTSRFCILM